MRALVVGGTGPTGHYIVNGLRKRGYEVAMLHSGRHELAEIPDDVEHIHTDAFDAEAVTESLGARTFDVAVVTYGRLRRLAQVLKGRTGQFLSVGGVPAYRGFMNAELFEPAGLPVPVYEDHPVVKVESEDAKGWRIVRTEEAVFDVHPNASHFRYPYVYGAYQLMPREWCIVRRILDRRPFMIVPDGGLTLLASGYAENLAHALLLAVDRPDAAAGQIYNCADEEALTVRQLVEICATALGHEWEIVNMPWELAVPARPLVVQPQTTHRVLDLAKLRTQLGYRDVVPAREAVARAAHWLAAHPPAPGGAEEFSLTDPFDYGAEDRLVAGWKRAMTSMPEIQYENEPGYTMSYSGPGGRPRSKSFEA